MLAVLVSFLGMMLFHRGENQLPRGCSHRMRVETVMAKEPGNRLLLLVVVVVLLLLLLLLLLMPVLLQMAEANERGILVEGKEEQQQLQHHHQKAEAIVGMAKGR